MLQPQFPKLPPLQWTYYQVCVQQATAMKHLAVTPCLLRFMKLASTLRISFSLPGFGTDWPSEIQLTEHHQGRVCSSHTHLSYIFPSLLCNRS